MSAVNIKKKYRQQSVTSLQGWGWLTQISKKQQHNMVMTVFNNTGPQNSSKTHINITSIQLQAQEKRIVQPFYRQIKNKNCFSKNKAMHSFSCKPCHLQLVFKITTGYSIYIRKSWQARNQNKTLTYNFKWSIMWINSEVLLPQILPALLKSLDSLKHIQGQSIC